MPSSSLPIPIPLSLRFLLPRASFVGCADVLVSTVTDCCDECRPGDTFAAIPGTRVDGADFALQAVRNGAKAVLTHRPLADVPVPQCVAPNVRAAYSRLCAALQDNPSTDLKTVGVTGTNGKTTVTWLIRSILAAAGRRCGMLGTVEYHDGLTAGPSMLTTPEPKTLNHWLGRMVESGTEYAAVEVSSHALHQDRIAGTGLDVAVITNITQDHFDYHGAFEDYAAAKARIIEHCKPDGSVVVNADDPRVPSMVRGNAGVTTFGIELPADVSAEILDESINGTRFLLRRGDETLEVRTPLVGRHNVMNCLAAAAAVSHFGVSLDAIAVGLASLESVPGRLERIDCGQPFAAFVDYAHTDDALERCVHALKQLTPGRVLCVLGAGGDRDRTKRPRLGRAGSTADLAVVTSDNPRSEDPAKIIKDIVKGIPADRPVHLEVDRAAAIRWAAAQAGPGDCLLVAGKGHETEQILGEQRIPFDDRQHLREAILALASSHVPQPTRRFLQLPEHLYAVPDD